MDDIWQQFHRLPKVIRDAVATPQALGAIDRLEQATPGLDLAGFVMRVMVKEFSVADLGKHLVTEAGLESTAADRVVDTLTQSVFQTVSEYLGLPKPTPAGPAPAAPAIPPPSAVIRPVDIQSPITPTPAPSAPLAPAAPSLGMPATPVGSMAPAPTLSTEDDAEIAAHAAKLRVYAASAAGPADFDTIAQRVIDQHQLAFPDELLTKRAVSMLKAQLKGIRSSDDTKAMMMRPPKVGGLGLDPDLATAVTVSIASLADKAKEQGMTREPAEPTPPPLPRIPPPEEQRPAVMPPLTRDFSGLKPDAPAVNVTEPPRMSRPIMRPADIPAPPPMPTARLNTQPSSSKPVAAVAAPGPEQMKSAPSPANQRPRSSDRPAVADITMPASTLGPAEEMKSYTLSQFRRLGQGVGESTNKILGKLQNLQNESFALWAQAVAGWRQSEVYRIYLDMGRESLEQSISIDQVIKHRAASALPYLSEHEFNALADMNRRLQF